MRLHLSDMQYARQAADALRDEFRERAIKLKLSQVQSLVAWLLGYQNWNELFHETNDGLHELPLLAEDSKPEELAVRREFQCEVLSNVIDRSIDECAEILSMAPLFRDFSFPETPEPNAHEAGEDPDDPPDRESE